MIKRIIFALKMGWRYRDRLREFEKNQTLQVKSLGDLNLSLLKSQGIKVLALDMDGVLVPYGQTQLDPGLIIWLKDCMEHWKYQIYIYSNKPNAARKNYFLNNFPGIGFIAHVRHKPYPDGIYQIMDKTKVAAFEILVVDDRLLTGILAALIAGAKAKWIIKPTISLFKSPGMELYFIFLRALERLALR